MHISRQHIKLDTTVQPVTARGRTGEQYDTLNAWYALKQSAEPPMVKGFINRVESPSEAWKDLEETSAHGPVGLNSYI